MFKNSVQSLSPCPQPVWRIPFRRSGRACGIRVLALILVAALLSVGTVRGDGIQFGIMAELPPYMFTAAQSGKGQASRFFTENLALAPRLGSTWNIVIAWQGIDGPDGYARLRRIAEDHEKRGQRLVVRLIEDSAVYADMRSAAFKVDVHTDYQVWVEGLARALAGKVDAYLVGNEPDINVANNYAWMPESPGQLYVGYSEYRVLLVSAVRAIRSVDPDVRIANGGLSDKTLALAYAADLYRKSGMDAALDAWRKWKEVGGDSVEGRVGLWKLLTARETERRIAFLEQAIADPAGTDLFQIHYYGGWRAVPELVTWLQDRMVSAGQGRPIVACEVGYRIPVRSRVNHGKRYYWLPDLARYDATEHATDMVKMFALLAGEGVEYLLYWNMRLREPRGMVVPLLGWSERSAEIGLVPSVYRQMTVMLKNGKPADGRLDPRTGLWERRFVGQRDVSVVWSEHPIALHLQAVDAVFDERGNTVSFDTGLQVGGRPYYIVWNMLD